MADLSNRIEAAEGADRLLDFDIAKEVFGRSIGVAKYTASVDAALTLVPEGLYPTICFLTKRVWLRDKNGHDLPGGVAYGFGKNVPNSICAAALRAKESSDGK